MKKPSLKLDHGNPNVPDDHSVSRQLTADILAELKRPTRSAEVHSRDLAEQPLPHWIPAVTDPTIDEAALSNALLKNFLATDTVVIGAPMYDFGFSSQLKA